MRRFFSKEEENDPVDELIAGILAKMQRTDESSEEYSDLMTKLERLKELKAKNRRSPVSSDTLAIVAGNLLVVLLIVGYEQKHVMTPTGIKQLLRVK